MPSRRTISEPPHVMTWKKASPVLVAAAVFDLIRGFFQLFWFFGPALAGVYCTVKVGGVWVIGKLLAAGCVALAAIGGVAVTEVTTPFGVIMADAVGLFAFLSIGLWIVITNTRLLKTVTSAPAQFAGAFALGEIPLLGAFPVFTVILWRLYKTQISIEKKVLEKWQKEQSVARMQEQQRAQAQLMQQQAVQQAQQEEVEAANDERDNEAA